MTRALPHTGVLDWTTIVIPFDRRLSKNRVWRRGNRGGKHLMYTPDEVTALLDAIAWQVKAASKGRVWRLEKVWVDLFVQMPDHRGDAINFLDACADAVANGIGVNDRWFALWGLDWSIQKANPTITISVGQ